MIPRHGGGGPGIGTADRTKLSSHHAANAYYTAGLRRRSAAAQRFSKRGCGCADPWRCRCDRADADAEPSGRMVDAYAQAVRHLDALGLTAAPNLPAMRKMWRRSPADRTLVATIASSWEVGT